MSFNPSNPHWKKDYCPLILPPPQKDINLGLNERLLPVMNMSELAVPSEDALYEFGQRTLIVLKGKCLYFSMLLC